MAMAAPSMRETLRHLIARALPWYEPAKERERDRHTEAVRQRSIRARLQSERIIADYEQADAAARRAAGDLIKEVRRRPR